MYDPPSPVLDLSVSCGAGNYQIPVHIAQTFTPTRTGVIDKLAIWLEPGDLSSSFTVEIIEGIPLYSPMGESETTIEARGLDKFYDFRFSSPIKVQAGTQYSWKLIHEDTNDGVLTNQCSDQDFGIPGNGYWGNRILPDVDYPFKLYILE